MNTSNHIRIAAPFETLFQRAADIAAWPEILPHYRWVKVISRNGSRVIAEMAARHKGLPLWWKTIQTADPANRRIHFTHIGGITKGMEVDWIFTPSSPAVVGGGSTMDSPPVTGGNDDKKVWHVRIEHTFNPSWSAAGRWFADRIIGRIFVQQVAQKTLNRMKQLAERASS